MMKEGGARMPPWRRRGTRQAGLLGGALLAALAVALLGVRGQAQGQAPNQITLSGFSRAPASVNAGTPQVAMLALTATSSSGVATVASIRVELTGSVTEGDIAPNGVHLWADRNGNAVIDGADTLLNSKPPLNGTVTLTVGVSVHWGLPAQLLVSMSFSAAAGNGHTVGVRVASTSDVISQAEAAIGGVYPIASGQAVIVAVNPDTAEIVEATGGVEQGSGGMLEAADGLVRAEAPPGATSVPLTMWLVRPGADALPPLPGLVVVAPLSLAWEAAEPGATTPPRLSAPVQITIRLAELASSIGRETLTVVALGTQGGWVTLPAVLSADGARLIVSVSVMITFAVVTLPGAAADVLPPAGGMLTSNDGRISVTMPAGASADGVQISLTPAAAPAALTGTATPVGPATTVAVQPVTNAPLSAPITVAIDLPAGTQCTATCPYAVYGQSPGGGPVQVLPSRVSADGAQLLVEITGAITVVVAETAAAASGQVAADRTGSVATPDGAVRVDAGSGRTPITISLAPVPADAATLGMLEGQAAADPIGVGLSAGDGSGSGGRSVTVEVRLSTAGGAANAASLRAYGVGADGFPQLLPSVVDGVAGVLRIAIDVSQTIYLTRDAPTRTVLLQPGWNLVTWSGGNRAPVSFLGTALQARLDSVHRWDSARGGYASYFHAAPTTGRLQTLDSEDAIWVRLSGSTALPLIMPDTRLAPRSLPLRPGWNLVSWSGAATPTLDGLGPLVSRMGALITWSQADQALQHAYVPGFPVFVARLEKRGPLWVYIDGAAAVTWPQPGA